MDKHKKILNNALRKRHDERDEVLKAISAPEVFLAEICQQVCMKGHMGPKIVHKGSYLPLKYA